MIGFMEAYQSLKGIQCHRHYYLFDSFGGFPSAKDETLDSYLKKGNEDGWYVASEKLLRWHASHVSKMLHNPTLNQRVHLIKGFFEETVIKHRARWLYRGASA